MPPLDPSQIPPDAVPPEAVPPEEGALPPEQANPLQGGIQQASPEEQAQADEFVLKAWQLIYDDRTFPQIVEMLKGGGGNPVQGLAMATDMVVSRVGQAAEDSGKELMPDAVMFAFGEVLEELAEVSRRAKIKDYAEDRDSLEGAYFQAIDLYRDRLQKAGVLDQESHKQGLEQLMQADKDGTLEQIMRQLAEEDSSGQAGGDVPPPEAEARPKRKGMGSAMGKPPASEMMGV
jgi:hypothetical protein